MCYTLLVCFKNINLYCSFRFQSEKNTSYSSTEAELHDVSEVGIHLIYRGFLAYMTSILYVHAIYLARDKKGTLMAHILSATTKVLDAKIVTEHPAVRHASRLILSCMKLKNII